MTFCPFARQELVGPHSSTSLIGHSLGLVFHVNAGDGDPWSTFELGQADSHWQIMKTGELIQYVDSDLDSWAQMAGNDSYHSCETEGYPTEALTPEQCATFARLYAWGHQVYGWPLAVAETVGEVGLGWHGMGGDAWGGHTGCPGELRKAQRPGILAAAAAALLAPAPTAVPAAPKPKPPTPGEPMQYINAHGRDHLFNVQADGKLVWRAHSPGGTWQSSVLTTGALAGSAPAAWVGGAVAGADKETPELYLQVTVELTSGAVFHAWTAPGAKWLSQILPAVT